MNVYGMSQHANVGRFVFISSMNAHAEAEAYYGRSKFTLEQQMDLSKDLVIRPGFIIGHGGAFHHLKESLLKTRIVPVFDGGRQILQTIYIDDLCQAIGLAVDKELTGLFVVAEPVGVEMCMFFRRVADYFNSRCILVPLPMRFTLNILQFMERLNIPFPLSSENLLGLKHLKYIPTAESLARIGMEVNSFEESLRLVSTVQ
jgi:nucleoside-diphosphate-sugar epimerase